MLKEFESLDRRGGARRDKPCIALEDSESMHGEKPPVIPIIGVNTYLNPDAGVWKTELIRSPSRNKRNWTVCWVHSK